MKKAEGREAIAFAAIVATLLLPPPPHGAAVPPATAGLERNCTRICGSISIPYPFGVEPGCYHSAGFKLTCEIEPGGDRSDRPPKLFLGDGSVNVLGISVSDSTVRINSRRLVYMVATGLSTVNGTWGSGLPERFFLLESRGSVALVGCGAQVDVRGGDQNSLITSCTAICPLDANQQIVVEKGSACTGVGCCQANIVLGYNSYDLQITKIKGLAYSMTTSVYLVDGDFRYDEDMSNVYGFYPEVLPATLDRVISNETCLQRSNNLCTSSNSVCQDGLYNTAHRGYRCACTDGYQGNPYLKEGCQDINECENQEAHSCYDACLNLHGTFQCQCPDGTDGDPFIRGGCAIKKSAPGLSIGLGVCGGTILLLLALFGPMMMRKIKQSKVRKMKEKYFKQNHGLLLQQLIAHKADTGERMVINLRELEKATNGFDRARIVGGGGHGVVFKGILDLRVVAIKRAKIVVQREIDEFINEVVVLSQINHRNVVKLLGCCLETEVPLLVYEFISNGTLHQHLHVEGPVSLKWDDRIRIAIQVSRALSYLHSAASMPIFHRDIKSSNILLDDTLTAKVSDFGASRYIPIDRTGVTTAIQGTMGYLDPMYLLHWSTNRQKRCL